MTTFIKKALVIAAAAMALVACDDHAGERAERLGATLVTHWQRGDSEALASFKARYDSVAGSLTLPWSRGTMARLFVEFVEREDNDTLTAAARAVALPPEDFADHYAAELIDSLRTSPTITPERAFARMTVVGTGAGVVGCVASAEAYSLELDRRTRAMPLDEQMRVYARAAITPEELGRALAEEYALPGADTALVRDRLEALRKIYDATSMSRCEASFNNNIKK